MDHSHAGQQRPQYPQAAHPQYHQPSYWPMHPAYGYPYVTGPYLAQQYGAALQPQQPLLLATPPAATLPAPPSQQHQSRQQLDSAPVAADPTAVQPAASHPSAPTPAAGLGRPQVAAPTHQQLAAWASAPLYAAVQPAQHQLQSWGYGQQQVLRPPAAGQPLVQYYALHQQPYLMQQYPAHMFAGQQYVLQQQGLGAQQQPVDWQLGSRLAFQLYKQLQQHSKKPKGQHGPQEPVFELLQLPEAVLCSIAACLTKQDRLALGTLVLPKASPTAAAAVLGTIQSVRFCTQVTNNLPSDHPCVKGTTHKHYSIVPHLMRDAPKFLTALQDLRSLSLELDAAASCASIVISKQKRGKQQRNRLVQPSGFPQLSKLTALSGLTSLQLTVQMTPGMKEQEQLGQFKRAVAAVGRLTNLQKLDIADGSNWKAALGGLVPLDHNSFASLSGLTGLQVLRLLYTPSVVDLGLGRLSRLSSLTELALEERSSGVTMPNPSRIVRGVAALAPFLDRLPLQKLTVHQHSVVVDLQLQPGQLAVLDVSNSAGLFPALGAQLAACTALQELRVSSCRGLSTESFKKAVSEFASSLTLLDLSNNGPSALVGTLDVLRQLKALKHLNIEKTRVCAVNEGGLGVVENHGLVGGSSGVCQVLALLTALTHLTIGCGPHNYDAFYVVPAHELMHLSALTNLHEVCIIGSRFSMHETQDDAVAAEWAVKFAACFSRWSNLTRLTLKGCGLNSYDIGVMLDALKPFGLNVDGLALTLSDEPLPIVVDTSDSDEDNDNDDMEGYLEMIAAEEVYGDYDESDDYFDNPFYGW